MVEHTDSARAVNPGASMDGFVALVQRMEGGWIPPAGSGAFNLSLWSFFTGFSVRRLKMLIQRERIPYRKLGAMILVDSGDMLKSLPFGKTNPEQDPPKRSRNPKRSRER